MNTKSIILALNLCMLSVSAVIDVDNVRDQGANFHPVPIRSSPFANIAAQQGAYHDFSVMTADMAPAGSTVIHEPLHSSVGLPRSASLATQAPTAMRSPRDASPHRGMPLQPWGSGLPVHTEAYESAMMPGSLPSSRASSPHSMQSRFPVTQAPSPITSPRQFRDDTRHVLPNYGHRDGISRRNDRFNPPRSLRRSNSGQFATRPPFFGMNHPRRF
jgi:hypothetical protein